MLLRWVDRYGIKTDDAHQVVALIRVRRIGLFAASWELWWASPLEAMAHRSKSAPRPLTVRSLAARGVTPTMWQAVIHSTAAVRHLTLREHP